MTTPEANPQNLVGPEPAALLEGIVDPLGLAAQALVKLQEQGLPTVVDETVPDSNTVSQVIELAEVRLRKQTQPIREKVARQSAKLPPEIAELLKADLSRSAKPYFGNTDNLSPEQRKLLEKHYHIVPVIARKLVGSWVGFHTRIFREVYEEALSDGYLGLFLAVSRYDVDKESPLTRSGIEYINKYIVGMIKRGQRDRHYHRATEKRGAVFKPSVMRGSAVSFDEPISAGEGLTFADVIPDETEFESDTVFMERVYEVARHYSKRDREIIFRRFNLGHTQSQIAAAIGISQMHVSRLIKRILTDLRDKLEIEVEEPEEDRHPSLEEVILKRQQGFLAQVYPILSDIQLSEGQINKLAIGLTEVLVRGSRANPDYFITEEQAGRLETYLYGSGLTERASNLKHSFRTAGSHWSDIAATIGKEVKLDLLMKAVNQIYPDTFSTQEINVVLTQAPQEVSNQPKIIDTRPDPRSDQTYKVFVYEDDPELTARNMDRESRT